MLLSNAALISALFEKQMGKCVALEDWQCRGPEWRARAIYLYEGNKDTLYRIHGTNQPEYIGQAISSGCIRMTNEDIIDLVNRVTLGAVVVVLTRSECVNGPITGSRRRS